MHYPGKVDRIMHDGAKVYQFIAAPWNLMIREKSCRAKFRATVP